MLLVLALRWLAFAWMLFVALVSGQVQRPVEATAALVVTFGWTAWLTFASVRRTGGALAVDLGLAVALLLVHGHVHPPLTMLTNHPSFMGAYPTAAVAAFGVVYRARGGVGAGVVLGLALPFAYAVNGVDLARLSFLQLLTVVGWALSYVLLGAAVGVAASQIDGLHRQVALGRERAAGLAERQRLIAHLHDDVLQHLGRLRARLGELSDVPALAAVAEGIGRQEAVLRDLARPDAPSGTASLRDRLSALADDHPDVPIKLVAGGPVRLPADMVAELGSAVAELLVNVVKHASATQVRLTVLADDDEVAVTVRDDGVGFAPEWEDSGLGLRFSVRARVSRLSGETRVRSVPGRGTEVELRVPLRAGEG